MRLPPVRLTAAAADNQRHRDIALPMSRHFGVIVIGIRLGLSQGRSLPRRGVDGRTKAQCPNHRLFGRHGSSDEASLLAERTNKKSRCFPNL
jgi:hypothetical protein